MEATLTLSCRLHSTTQRLLTSFDHSPNSKSFHQPSLIRCEANAANALQMNGGYMGRSIIPGGLSLRKRMCGPAHVEGSQSTPTHTEPEGQRPNSKLDALLLMDRGDVKDRDIPIDQLQELAWKLELTDKLDGVVELLKILYDAVVRNNDNRQALTLGLLLVETRIYQGDFEGANVLCYNVMDKYGTLDATLQQNLKMYQDLINLMMSEGKDFASEAHKFWTDHVKSAEKTSADTMLEFAVFVDKIKKLREEILMKKAKKQATKK